jgi:hypothetical protein
MPEFTDLLELAERAVEHGVPLPGSGIEDLHRRRARRVRNRRVGAGLVGVAVAALVALAGTRALLVETEPRHTSTPTPSIQAIGQGFVGAPPEGMAPTAPVSGELLLRLSSGWGDETFEYDLYLYADGRIIWDRHEGPTGVEAGAMKRYTGYLTQVLTPEGAEILRSEVLGTGVLQEDLHLRGTIDGYEHLYGMEISVLGADGMVAVTWSQGYEDERKPTPEELEALSGLLDRLADVGAWMPASGWADPTIRPFVAEHYGVNFSLVLDDDGECCKPPDPTAMPPPADRILTEKFNQCITTDEARELADGLLAGGIEPSVDNSWAPALRYTVGEGSNGVPQTMVLYPLLPDGGGGWCR